MTAWLFCGATFFAFTSNAYAIAKLNLNDERKNVWNKEIQAHCSAAEIKLLALRLRSRILCQIRSRKRCEYFKKTRKEKVYI